MYWEVKKIFDSKITLGIIVMLILLLIPNIISASKNKADDADEKKIAVDKVYAEIKNEGYEGIEQYEQLEKMRDEMFDLSMEGDVSSYEPKYSENFGLDSLAVITAFNEAEYIYDIFPSSRNDIIYNAVYDIIDEEAKVNPDEVHIARNNYIIETYNQYVELSLAATRESGFYSYFHLGYWEYALLAFLVIISVRVFTMDSTESVLKVINSSVRNKGKLFLNRYLAATFIPVIMLVLQWILQLIIVRYTYGINDFSIAIQNFEEYRMCPLVITLGQFFLLDLAVKIMAVFGIVAVIMFLTSVIRNRNISLILSGIIILIPYGVMDMLTQKLNKGELISGSFEYEVLDFFRTFSGFGLLNVKSYLTYMDVVNVGTTFMLRLTAVMLITLLSILFMLPLSYFIEKRKYKQI